jgi:hypothetical protein
VAFGVVDAVADAGLQVGRDIRASDSTTSKTAEARTARPGERVTCRPNPAGRPVSAHVIAERESADQTPDLRG